MAKIIIQNRLGWDILLQGKKIGSINSPTQGFSEVEQDKIVDHYIKSGYFVKADKIPDTAKTDAQIIAELKAENAKLKAEGTPKKKEEPKKEEEK